MVRSDGAGSVCGGISPPAVFCHSVMIDVFRKKREMRAAEVPPAYLDEVVVQGK